MPAVSTAVAPATVAALGTAPVLVAVLRLALGLRLGLLHHRLQAEANWKSPHSSSSTRLASRAAFQAAYGFTPSGGTLCTQLEVVSVRAAVSWRRSLLGAAW